MLVDVDCGYKLSNPCAGTARVKKERGSPRSSITIYRLIWYI